MTLSWPKSTVFYTTCRWIQNNTDDIYITSLFQFVIDNSLFIMICLSTCNIVVFHFTIILIATLSTWDYIWYDCEKPKHETRFSSKSEQIFLFKRFKLNKNMVLQLQICFKSNLYLLPSIQSWIIKINGSLTRFHSGWLLFQPWRLTKRR